MIIISSLAVLLSLLSAYVSIDAANAYDSNLDRVCIDLRNYTPIAANDNPGVIDLGNCNLCSPPSEVHHIANDDFSAFVSALVSSELDLSSVKVSLADSSSNFAGLQNTLSTGITRLDEVNQIIIDGSNEEHFKVLGLQCEATQVEIRDAWKNKSLEFHPDKHPLVINNGITIDQLTDVSAAINDANRLLTSAKLPNGEKNDISTHRAYCMTNRSWNEVFSSRKVALAHLKTNVVESFKTLYRLSTWTNIWTSVLAVVSLLIYVISLLPLEDVKPYVIKLLGESIWELMKSVQPYAFAFFALFQHFSDEYRNEQNIQGMCDKQYPSSSGDKSGGSHTSSSGNGRIGKGYTPSGFNATDNATDSGVVFGPSTSQGGFVATLFCSTTLDLEITEVRGRIPVTFDTYDASEFDVANETGLLTSNNSVEFNVVSNVSFVSTLLGSELDLLYIDMFHSGAVFGPSTSSQGFVATLFGNTSLDLEITEVGGRILFAFDTYDANVSVLSDEYLTSQLGYLENKFYILLTPSTSPLSVVYQQPTNNNGYMQTEIADTDIPNVSNITYVGIRGPPSRGNNTCPLTNPDEVSTDNSVWWYNRTIRGSSHHVDNESLEFPHDADNMESKFNLWQQATPFDNAPLVEDPDRHDAVLRLQGRAEFPGDGDRLGGNEGDSSLLGRLGFGDGTDDGSNTGGGGGDSGIGSQPPGPRSTQQDGQLARESTFRYPSLLLPDGQALPDSNVDVQAIIESDISHVNYNVDLHVDSEDSISVTVTAVPNDNTSPLQATPLRLFDIEHYISYQDRFGLPVDNGVITVSNDYATLRLVDTRRYTSYQDRFGLPPVSTDNAILRLFDIQRYVPYQDRFGLPLVSTDNSTLRLVDTRRYASYQDRFGLPPVNYNATLRLNNSSILENLDQPTSVDSSSEVQLFVRGFDIGTHAVDISLSDNVESLQAKLESKTGITPGGQVMFVCNGKRLEKGNTLYDSGCISNGSTVQVSFLGRGGIGGSGRLKQASEEENSGAENIRLSILQSNGRLDPLQGGSLYFITDNVGQGDCGLYAFDHSLQMAFGTHRPLSPRELRSFIGTWLTSRMDEPVMPGGETPRTVIANTQTDTGRTPEEYVYEITTGYAQPSRRFYDEIETGMYLTDSEFVALGHMFDVNVDIYGGNGDRPRAAQLRHSIRINPNRPTVSLMHYNNHWVALTRVSSRAAASVRIVQHEQGTANTAQQSSGTAHRINRISLDTINEEERQEHSQYAASSGSQQRKVSIDSEETSDRPPLSLPTTDQELFDGMNTPPSFQRAVTSVRDSASSNKISRHVSNIIDLANSGNVLSAEELVSRGNQERGKLGKKIQDMLDKCKDLEAEYAVNIERFSVDDKGQLTMHYAPQEDADISPYPEGFSTRNDNNGCVRTQTKSVPRAMATEHLRQLKNDDSLHADFQPPHLSIVDMIFTTLVKPDSKLGEGDEVLDRQVASIAACLGMTPEEIYVINWSISALGHVIYAKENGRQQSNLIGSNAVTRRWYGQTGPVGTRSFQTSLMNAYESPHGEVLLAGRQLFYNEETRRFISSSLQDYWISVINNSEILSNKFPSTIADWFGKKDGMTKELLEDVKRARAAGGARGRARALEVSEEARNHYDTSILAELTPLQAVAVMKKELSRKHVNKFLNEQRFGLESDIAKEMKGGAVVSDKRIKQLAANRGLTESDFDIDRIRDNAKSQRSNRDDMVATTRKGMSEEEYKQQQRASTLASYDKKVEEDIRASGGHGFTLRCPGGGIRAKGSCTFTRTIGRDKYNDMTRKRFACENHEGSCFPGKKEGGRPSSVVGWTAKPFCQDCRNQEQCHNCKISTSQSQVRPTGKTSTINLNIKKPAPSKSSKKKGSKTSTSSTDTSQEKKKKNSSTTSSSNAPQKKTKKRKPTSTSSSAPIKKLKGAETEQKKKKKVDPMYRFFDPAPAPAPKAPAPAPAPKKKKKKKKNADLFRFFGAPKKEKDNSQS